MNNTSSLYMRSLILAFMASVATILVQAQTSVDSIIERIDSIGTVSAERAAAMTPVRESMQPIFASVLATQSAQPLDLNIAPSSVDYEIDPEEFYKRWRKVKPIKPVSIYALPYSMTGESRDWKRLWINTSVLAGAFIGSLIVLECLPEDATSWNRAELQKDPPFKRWYMNVIKKGPAWDRDNAIFNYVLHPYAGAAYFMAARSCGFNFYRSLLYSACISTIGWEFGIEACMERPSYQDLLITPLVGAIFGEGFYMLKRVIVNNGYEVAGSRFLGGVVAFLIDPVNEFIGYFAGNPARKVATELRVQPTYMPNYKGISMALTF